MKKETGMNKDDFLKLFLAQLKYQDPTKPQDASALLTQLSQLTQVEQAYNTTSALNNLLTAQNNSAALTSVGFIGKDVKANGDQISFDGSTPSLLEFNLPVPSSAATVTISDALGQTVRIANIGALAAGDASFTWDGRSGSGTMLPAGVYTVKVEATSASGDAVTAATYTTGRITGVNLAGNTPVLTIGSASVPLTDILSVKGV